MNAIIPLVIAIIVIVVIIIVLRKRKHKGGSKNHFTSDSAENRRSGTAFKPRYSRLHDQLTTVGEMGVAGPREGVLTRDLTKYYRVGAEIQPQDLSKAIRANWYTQVGSVAGREDVNTEHFSNPADEFMNWHEERKGIDNNQRTLDLVMDPRTRENHRRHVEEMMPFSQTGAVMYDTFEPENYIHRWGIRSFSRPVVAQYGQAQIQGHVDAEDYARLSAERTRRYIF